jgi:hypothetical protein
MHFAVSYISQIEIKHMENKRIGLWAILISQVLFLVGSFIDPPSGWVMIILRVLIPVLLIVYFGLLISGFTKPREK